MYASKVGSSDAFHGKLRFCAKKTSQTVLGLLDTGKQKIYHILCFFFDKDENANHAAAIVNSIYSSDIVIANLAQKRSALGQQERNCGSSEQCQAFGMQSLFTYRYRISLLLFNIFTSF